MKIPKLDINGLIVDIPIVQGAMGIGVSGPCLAAAVANEGGVGVLAGVNLGYKESDFYQDKLKADLRALKAQLQKVRELSPKGVIGINLMVAMNHYEEIARAAAQGGIDLIISGAGLPTKLPQYVEGLKTRIAPIVSSGKAAKVILHYWEKHYGRTADMIVVEGPEAGGHLGFSNEVLTSANHPPVMDLVKEVLETIQPFQEKFNRKIPVIAAGGIYTGADIADCLKEGASGVQMATRFVATEECDAHSRFKEEYIKAKEEDVVILQSPVGMPGRAIHNKFLKEVAESKKKITSCVDCLRTCDPKVAPYCISTALIHSVTGNVDEGLVFAGSNVHRVDRILSVKELMNELVHDTEVALG